MNQNRRMRTVVSIGGVFLMGPVLGCSVETGSKDDLSVRELDQVHDEGSVISGIKRQTRQEALDEDVSLTAKGLGIPEQIVREKLEFQSDFQKQTQVLMAKYGERISGAWMDPLPAIRGYVRFIGKPPAGASFTGKWATQVDLLDDGLFSERDLTAHVDIATSALKSRGYREFAIYYSPSEQSLVIETTLGPVEHPAMKRLIGDNLVAVAAGQPGPRLENRSESSIRSLPTRVLQRKSEDFVPVPEHTYGGCWMAQSNSVNMCTSGWSVEGPDGDGVLTAGHCVGITQFRQPDVGLYSTTWRDQVYGDGGDVEYHTTSHPEYAEFYSDASTLREVNSLWFGGLFPTSGIGATVCQYGRASNNRQCDKTVVIAHLTVVDSAGVTITGLTRTNNPSSIPGDSGGGWSYGTEAFGIHMGKSATYGFFTPVLRAQMSLNVNIMTQ